MQRMNVRMVMRIAAIGVVVRQRGGRHRGHVARGFDADFVAAMAGRRRRGLGLSDPGLFRQALVHQPRKPMSTFSTRKTGKVVEQFPTPTAYMELPWRMI